MVNTRRTTLGGISTNRRVSLAGGFESTTTTTKTSSKARKQRMSMAPRLSNNDRRSSLVPPTGTNYNRRKSVGDHHRLSSIPPPATMRSDPRSISDKVFLSKCIRNLHQYLENNGYEHQIKLKDLSRPGPSAKDFHNFMTFLLRKIDPTFNSSPKRKFEDDVVVAFKVIGYPFNISKTALVAAGSPHTWPTLLLPITWLIEVLEGGSGFSMLQEEFESIESVGAAGVTFEGVEAMETRTEKAFLKYVEVSYGSFLSGDDENAEKLEIEFLEYHEKDDVLLEHVIEKVMDENAAAEEAYNELCREGGDLPERERHLEDLANDIETFQVLIQQLTDHKTALTEKVQSSTTQLQQKEDILEKKEAKLNHLRQVIEQQQFSMEDIHKLENEVANMKETIRQTKLARQKNEDSTLNGALDLEKVFEKLHSVVEMFNSTLQELNLDDDSEQDSSYTISIQKTCADKDQSELLGGVDLKGVVMRSWHEKKIN